MKTYEVKNKFSNKSQSDRVVSNQSINSDRLELKALITNDRMRRINIDSRILPLFRTPLFKENLVENQDNTRNYSLKIKALLCQMDGPKLVKGESIVRSLSHESTPIRSREGVLRLPNKNNLKKIFTNDILKLFYKGLILYNLNLKSFLLQENKLNLILNIKNDKLYKLNTQISAFFKLVNKLIFEDNDRGLDLRKTVLGPNIRAVINKDRYLDLRKSLTKKSDTLFVPFGLALKDENKENFEKKICKATELVSAPSSNRSVLMDLKPNSLAPNIGWASISKAFGPNEVIVPNRKMLFTHKISKKKISMEIENNKELIKFGIEIINNLNFQISQNEILINKTKKYQKVLDLIKNTTLSHLIGPKNSNLKYNLMNNNPSLSDNTITNNSTSSYFKARINNLGLNRGPNELEEFNNKKLLLIKMLLGPSSVNKSNEIKIDNTINSIIKNKEFDYKTDSISINSNPISLVLARALFFGTNHNNSEIGNNNNSNTPIINKYLKAMSKYNMKNKGISIYYSKIIGYKFNSNTNKLIKNIYNLLAYSFKSMYCLISKPVFVITSNKIIIQLFYYLFIPNILKAKKIYKIKGRKNLRFYLTWKKRRNKIRRLYRKFRKININSRIKLRKLYLFNITKIFPDKLKKLCEILSNLFKKSVELDLIRLHYPYNDSNILANLLAIMINRIKLRIIAKRLFGKAVLKNKKFSSTKTNKNKLNIIPAFLSGITIKVAGRLLNNKIVPRKTVKTIRRGAVAKGKINYLDVARYTNKNKRGAYSITISSGQNYF
jgi:hypothetical protein